MLFHAEAQYEEIEMRTGKYEPVACDCWFTSKGRMKPRFVKMYIQGELCIIPILRVLSEEERRYAGISVRAYHCVCKDDERLRQFQLLYFKENCLWKIEWLS